MLIGAAVLVLLSVSFAPEAKCHTGDRDRVSSGHGISLTQASSVKFTVQLNVILSFGSLEAPPLQFSRGYGMFFQH